MAQMTNHSKTGSLSGKKTAPVRTRDDIFDRALARILGTKNKNARNPLLKVRVFNILIDGDGRHIPS